MNPLFIHSKIHDYRVNFCDIKGIVNEIQDQQKAFFIVDEKMWSLYSDSHFKKFNKDRVLTIFANEKNKSLSSVNRIYKFLLEGSAKRNSLIIAIGGGTIQDICGFAASTYNRGVKWLFIPTTLLSQVDSCIGAKTSINYAGYKNIIGTFYPPLSIYISCDFLQTLPKKYFMSGMGEMVKLHILGGESRVNEMVNLLPQMLNRNSDDVLKGIVNSLKVKRSYILEDEFDLGRRKNLNYGHCFGHAIESILNFQIPHGQAVVVGMLLANKVSVNRGLLSAKIEADIRNRLLLPVITSKINPGKIDKDLLIAAMKLDKKRVDEGLAIIVVKDGCEFEMLSDVEQFEISDALKWICSIL